MDDLSRFSCPNPDCPEHGKPDAGNLTVTQHYGPSKARRMLRCRACEARFSERRGTPGFDSRLPPEKLEIVLDHIAKGYGVRETARACGVNRGTVGRLRQIAGEPVFEFDDELIRRLSGTARPFR
jgi:transposase-like protein